MKIDDILNFDITTDIFDARSRLMEAMDVCRNTVDRKMMMRLAKTSLIRSVNSSLAIEGNGLEPYEVADIINDRTVIGPFDEIVETRNALEAYGKVKGYDTWSMDDFLDAQDTVMFGLVETPGFRDHRVVVAEGDRIIYMAPPPHDVEPMMARLFEWGESSELPPEIVGSVIHYYIEAIHPFPDGNGRMGRLWNSKILNDSDPTYEMVSLETQILRRRDEYYDVLERCQRSEPQNCTGFIGFILGCMTDAFLSLSHIGDDRISALLDAMEDRPMTSNEIMARMGLSHKTNFMRRYLNPAMDLGLVFRTEHRGRSRNQMYRKMVRPPPAPGLLRPSFILHIRIREAMELEDVVLERIVPSPETVASIRERADRLKALVEDYVASHGITAEARFAGSFSKNTFLADPDLDLFLMFPPEVSPEDLRRIGLQAGEDILHGERMFSDHPYTRGVFEGIEVDMVPCFRIDSTEHLKSAVDRTPFHTAFIKSSLDEAGCNQVRLLKKFMKGIGAYGAEQDSRGFSGYLCEVLVVRFGSFRGVLEAASRWREHNVIEVRGRGPSMDAPLVVYDPVDNRRNVASAVHLDTMCLFIQAAREYLREPRMEFFFPNARRPMDREALEARIASHGSRLTVVRFPRPDAIEDNLQSQLWKTQNALARRLDSFGFRVLRAEHAMDDTHMTVAFELERDVLPATHRHIGPPVWVDSTPFLERWKGNPHGEPFIEDGHWVVVADRQYATAATMLEREGPISGIGKELDTEAMEILDSEAALDSIDPLLLTELLDPRMPWENRRRTFNYRQTIGRPSGPVG